MLHATGFNPFISFVFQLLQRWQTHSIAFQRARICSSTLRRCSIVSANIKAHTQHLNAVPNSKAPHRPTTTRFATKHISRSFAQLAPSAALNA